MTRLLPAPVEDEPSCTDQAQFLLPFEFNSQFAIGRNADVTFQELPAFGVALLTGVTWPLLISLGRWEWHSPAFWSPACPQSTPAHPAPGGTPCHEEGHCLQGSSPSLSFYSSMSPLSVFLETADKIFSQGTMDPTRDRHSPTKQVKGSQQQHYDQSQDSFQFPLPRKDKKV